MSDYNDFVDSILSKAKDFASAETVTGAVDKVKGAVSSSGITDVLEKGSQRAKNFGTATKATLDLNREYKELDHVFSEIGKLYYEQSASAPEGFFAPLFEQVNLLRESIAAKEAEIEAYKASFEAADQGDGGQPDDFESVVNRTENDGTSL